ncbi:MAG: TIM barrel protein, partial [Candidatus Sumerlaeota bacterium]|nr:TIM barrel protein [Candidatus Sumerlaeota bacterium]
MKNTLAKKQPILLLLPIFVAAFATNPHDQCCFATDAPASAASAASATQAAKSLLNPFFAMDTGVRDTTHTTFASQTQMIADLGYAGMDHMGLRAIPEKLKELDARHLKLFAIYTGANIDPDKPPYDPALKDALPALKGQSAVIWVHVSSKHWKPSDPEGDERAVKIIQEIADLVAPSGLRVALYPHAGDWIERVEDAVRVAKKAERKNVGVTFNLCHWLRV